MASLKAMLVGGVMMVSVLSTRAVVPVKTEARVAHAEGRWVAVFRNISAEQRADHLDRHKAIANAVRESPQPNSVDAFRQPSSPFFCELNSGHSHRTLCQKFMVHSASTVLKGTPPHSATVISSKCIVLFCFDAGVTWCLRLQPL